MAIYNESNSKEEHETNGSIDCCSVQPDNQFVGTSLRVETAVALSAGGSLLLGMLPERGLS